MWNIPIQSWRLAMNVLEIINVVIQHPSSLSRKAISMQASKTCFNSEYKCQEKPPLLMEDWCWTRLYNDCIVLIRKMIVWMYRGDLQLDHPTKSTHSSLCYVDEMSTSVWHYVLQCTRCCYCVVYFAVAHRRWRCFVREDIVSNLCNSVYSGLLNTCCVQWGNFLLKLRS